MIRALAALMAALVLSGCAIHHAPAEMVRAQQDADARLLARLGDGRDFLLELVGRGVPLPEARARMAAAAGSLELGAAVQQQREKAKTPETAASPPPVTSPSPSASPGP